MVHRAPGFSPRPSAAARACPGSSELLPHGVSTATRIAFTRGKRGQRPPRDMDRLPLSCALGRAKCPRIPAARHRLYPAGCSSSCPGLPREQAAESLGAAGAGTGWPAGGRGGRRSKPNKRKITPNPGEGSSSTGACALGRGKSEPRVKTEICLPAEPCCSPADLRCLPAAGARGRGAEPRRGWGGRAEPRRARQSTAGRAGSAELSPVGQTGTIIAGRRNVLRTASLQRSVVSLRARSPPCFEDGSPSTSLRPSSLCLPPGEEGRGKEGRLGLNETTRAAAPFARGC